MAVSQVELCNLALSRAGGQRITQITSLGEASNEARQCAVKLPHLIRIALRAHEWHFAQRRIALSRLADTLYWGEGIAYQYPSDCLAALRIFSVTDNAQCHFHEELAADGTRVLLCAAADAVLVYIAEVTDPVVWDPLFYDALAWQLAAELAVSLGNDTQKAQILEKMAAQAWARAKSVDFSEQSSSPYAGSYLRCRS